MSNIIIFSAIFLIVFLLFIKALRSFLNQRQIRRLLKKEIRSNKREIRQARGRELPKAGRITGVKS